jgi:hypothetical protein
VLHCIEEHSHVANAGNVGGKHDLVASEGLVLQDWLDISVGAILDKFHILLTEFTLGGKPASEDLLPAEIIDIDEDHTSSGDSGW